MTTVITTPIFWDCECKENYIHLKADTPACRTCNTWHYDQPDSHVNEVAALLGPEYEHAPDLLEKLRDLVQAHVVRMGPSAVNLRVELAQDIIAKAKSLD